MLAGTRLACSVVAAVAQGSDPTVVAPKTQQPALCDHAVVNRGRALTAKASLAVVNLGAPVWRFQSVSGQGEDAL